MVHIPELQEIFAESEEPIKPSDEFVSLYNVSVAKVEELEQNLRSANIPKVMRDEASRIMNEALGNVSRKELSDYANGRLVRPRKPTSEQLAAWESLNEAASSVERAVARFNEEVNELGQQ